MRGCYLNKIEILDKKGTNLESDLSTSKKVQIPEPLLSFTAFKYLF